MKKLLFITALLLSSMLTMAQVPQAMNFQAVIRNSEGNLLAEKTIAIKLSILQGSAEGTAVYEETHNSTSAKNGVVNLQIGKGNPINGTFSNIDWSLSPYFIKLSMDTDGGNSFKEIATSQMLSVPYALYAERAGKTNEEPKEEVPTFIVTQTDNDNTSMFLTGAGVELEWSSIGIYIAYLDGKDQEVTYDLKGLPLSDLKVIKEVSGPYGKFLDIEFSHEGKGEKCSGTFILKNKYGITKEYPFTIIATDTTSNPINPTPPSNNIDDLYADLISIYSPFRGQSELLDLDFMRILETSSFPNSSIYDKTYTPSDSVISEYYRNAYQIINKANVLIENGSITTRTESSPYQEFINNAIAIRAYTYLMLTTWFGDVPLITNVPTVEEASSISRTPRAEVLQFIIEELRKLHEEGIIPPILDPMIFNSMLNKAYLLKKDYNKVVELINRNENTHPLFTFIQKIANWKLGNLSEIPENTTETSLMKEYMDNLYQEDKDGNLFLNVLEYSATYFNMESYKALLPIPQSEIDINPNMTQNPGY